MKHLFALSAFAVALGIASLTASAQSTPPSLPPLTQAQSQELATRMDSYRRATDARVAQNEITVDEGARLLQWREWQIAQQIAAATPAPPPATASRAPTDYPPVPPDYRESVPPASRDGAPPDYYAVEPAPTYVPYYSPAVPYYPYYYGPRPYAYWGPSVCAGGFGRHFGGRVCF